MKSFDEAFYTSDYDQGMLDFIEGSYPTNTLWTLDDRFLNYAPVLGCFWTDNYKPDHWSGMTKEEFKRKIGMIAGEEKVVDKNTSSKTFSKSDLVDGMIVEIREPFEEVSLYLVKDDLLLSKTGHNHLEDYQDDLTLTEGVSEWDIVKVYTVDKFRSLTLEDLSKTLVWARPPEKTTSNIKLESLQQKMESLQEEMNILQKLIEAGE